MIARAAFAIPGDETQLSGGYIYERSLLDALREIGVAVEHLRLPDGFPDPSAAALSEAEAQLSAVDPGTPLILDGFLPACLGAETLARLRAPLFPIIHHPLGLETGLTRARADWLLQAERDALRAVRHIFVPSDFIGRLLVDGFDVPAAKILTVSPGFEGPIRQAAPTEPPLILAVGLLAPRKGHDVLIDALARLRDLDWRARIAGAAHDPTVERALAVQIETLGLGGRVELAGEIARDALQSAYAETSIFTLATRYEGYGIVFGEAMRWGLPIVATTAGAVPETVGDAGLLVPPDDPEALAGALRALLTDPAKRATIADRAARRGRALPTWTDAAHKVADAIGRTS